MKTIHKCLLLALFSPLSVAFAQPWSVDFNQNPPYVPGNTVIGVDGWQSYTLHSGNDTDVMIVENPNDSSRNILRLISSRPAGAGANGYHSTINQTISPVQGKVQVNALMGITWSSTTAGLPASIFFNTTSNTPFEFGFTPNLGLFYATAGADAAHRVSILPISEVKSGYLYSFEIIMDFENKTTDFYVTGLDVNDQIVDLSFEGLSFRPGSLSATGINNVFISNRRGDRLTMYVDSISIQAIPEPSTVAALIGALGLLIVFLRRKK